MNIKELSVVAVSSVVLAVAAPFALAQTHVEAGVTTYVNVPAESEIDYKNAQPMPMPSYDGGPAPDSPYNTQPAPGEKCNGVSVPCDTQASADAHTQVNAGTEIDAAGEAFVSYWIFTPIVVPMVSFFAGISAFFGF